MNTLNNYKRYPKIFFPRKTIEVDGKEYQYYKAKFGNLYDIYNYIKSQPAINSDIFYDLKSIRGSTSAAGLPFDDALEDLNNSEDVDFTRFIKMVKDIVQVKKGKTHKYVTDYTVAGGQLDTVLYSVGEPLCYEVVDKISTPKYINIYSTLAYSNVTSKYQVFNRAIVMLGIINAIEKRGYSVRLNSFEMVINDDEIVNIILDVKQHGKSTNLRTLYKSSCRVEFLRRILFRILETMPVETSWGIDYGAPCTKEFVQKVLNLSKNDIYFGTPQELGIGGGDLQSDFLCCIEKLNLGDKFNIREINEEFCEKVKRYVR
jgi:hypothetical protein